MLEFFAGIVVGLLCALGAERWVWLHIKKKYIANIGK